MKLLVSKNKKIENKIIEMKLSMWIKDPEEDAYNQYLIHEGGRDPSEFKDPYTDRIAVLLHLYGGDRFHVAFALKSDDDQHNRHLENAILKYRIKNKIITQDFFDIVEIKKELFSDLKYPLRQRMRIDDASREALTRIFCQIALSFLRQNEELEYYTYDDVLYAIFEHNQNEKNKRKIPVPAYFKKEYKELCEQDKTKRVVAKMKVFSKK